MLSAKVPGIAPASHPFPSHHTPPSHASRRDFSVIIDGSLQSAHRAPANEGPRRVGVSHQGRARRAALCAQHLCAPSATDTAVARPRTHRLCPWLAHASPTTRRPTAHALPTARGHAVDGGASPAAVPPVSPVPAVRPPRAPLLSSPLAAPPRPPSLFFLCQSAAFIAARRGRETPLARGKNPFPNAQRP